MDAISFIFFFNFYFFIFYFLFFLIGSAASAPAASHKESRLAFVKVQISLGNYHASNMREGWKKKKGDALPSGPL